MFSTLGYKGVGIFKRVSKGFCKLNHILYKEVSGVRKHSLWIAACNQVRRQPTPRVFKCMLFTHRCSSPVSVVQNHTLPLKWWLSLHMMSKAIHWITHAGKLLWYQLITTFSCLQKLDDRNSPDTCSSRAPNCSCKHKNINELRFHPHSHKPTSLTKILAYNVQRIPDHGQFLTALFATVIDSLTSIGSCCNRYFS